MAKTKQVPAGGGASTSRVLASAEADEWRWRLRYRIGLGAVVFAALALRIVFSWPWPDERRFWDERYSLENVRSLYEDRTFLPARSFYPSPVFNLPPTVLVAGSERLATALGDDRFAAIEERGFLPASYRWLRGLQAVYGTLAVVFIYLVGVRAFGRPEGYLAALMVAFMGWQVRVGGVFKPDALLMMTVVAAFLASLRQIQKPGWLGAMVTGVMIALAASAKLTGLMIAAPLAVVALVLGRRDPRYWRDLAIAGVTSFVAFVALNPYWTAYPVYIRALRQDYAMRAGWEEMSRLQVPARVFDFVTSAEVFGWPLGVAALAAFALLIARALSRRVDAMGRANAAMIVIFPVAFGLSYGLQTSYFKPNQFLVIVPFLGLALAWVAVSLWRRLSRGRERRNATAWGAAVLAAVTLLAGWNGLLFVYRALVPSTLDLAKAALSYHSRIHQRIYLAEEAVWPRGNPWERSSTPSNNRVILEPVESLEAVSEARMALADGWILPGGDSEFHQAIRNSVEGRDQNFFAVDRFETKWFEVRGSDIEVVSAWLRPRSPRAPVEFEACGRGCVAGLLPGRSVRHEAAAFVLKIPARDQRTGNPVPVFELDGRRVALLRQTTTDGYLIFHSERVVTPKLPSRWVLRAEWPARLRPTVEVSTWQSWPTPRGAGKADEMRVGELVEPGKIQPGEEAEDDDN